MANLEAMQKCAKIVATEPTTRLVVVSASAGVTNHLVTLSNSLLTQNQIEEVIEQIRDIQLGILRSLDSPAELAEKLKPIINHR